MIHTSQHLSNCEWVMMARMTQVSACRLEMAPRQESGAAPADIVHAIFIKSFYGFFINVLVI